MVNCKYEGCNTRASFGNENKKPVFCTNHKSENMFLVTAKLCQGENCKKYPHYNFIGETRGIYCREHKIENMLVVGTLCVNSGCISLCCATHICATIRNR